MTAKFEEELRDMIRNSLDKEIGDFSEAELDSYISSNLGYEVHPNIICDICDVAPITGDRYKCAVLDDFDMCEDCEEGVDHPYPTLKITDPNNSVVVKVTVNEPPQHPFEEVKVELVPEEEIHYTKLQKIEQSVTAFTSKPANPNFNKKSATIIDEPSSTKTICCEKGKSVELKWRVKNMTHKTWPKAGVIVRNFSPDVVMKPFRVPFSLQSNETGEVRCEVKIGDDVEVGAEMMAYVHLIDADSLEIMGEELVAEVLVTPGLSKSVLDEEVLYMDALALVDTGLTYFEGGIQAMKDANGDF